ncbi:CoA-binding protein, partial [Candidatus Poribacteria bacterium]|nr:CoA-binding protein [Candidatus Poribacteria bacterium]
MLDNFFKPESVAVIGASREAGKVGYELFKNLLEHKFPGPVYPVNPKADEILGLKAYKSVTEIPGKVDLAAIVVPAKFTPSVIQECGKMNVNSVIIISAGFKESGSAGTKLEQEIAQYTQKMNIRVLGPNCLGLIDTHGNLNASFAQGMPSKGEIAFFSQSGALGTAVLDWAIDRNIGLSKFISLGNKMDICESDLIEALANDPKTSVILGYIEGVKDGRRFIDIASDVTKKKPVVIMKSGSTAAGAKAASSHTGTLAGSDNAFQAAFKQCGVIRAQSIAELFNFALTMAYQPLPKGNRLAIITNAGGPGIIAADACEKSSLTMAGFQRKTTEKLRNSLPPTAAIYNPVDVIGDAKSDRYISALEAVEGDENTDAVLVLMSPQAMTEPIKTAQGIIDRFKGSQKPVLTSLLGGASLKEGIELLEKNKIPNFSDIGQAITSLDAAFKQYSWENTPVQQEQNKIEIDEGKVKEILKRAEHMSENTLTGKDAMAVLSEYGFLVPEMGFAETGRDAIKLANQIGYP